MSHYIPDHNDCRNPRYYVTQDGEFKRRPCGSRKCHILKCRQAWARKEAAIMLRSFRELPPTHFVVLQCRSFAGIADCRQALRRFLRLLRCRIACEYKWVIEPDANGLPHVHILLRATVPISRRRIRRMWRRACGSPVRTHCGAVRIPAATARYVTKACQATPQVPQEWHGPLSGHSLGFLTKRKAQLWAEEKSSWHTSSLKTMPHP
jgi:hypothetical protein